MRLLFVTKKLQSALAAMAICLCAAALPATSFGQHGGGHGGGHAGGGGMHHGGGMPGGMAGGMSSGMHHSGGHNMGSYTGGHHYGSGFNSGSYGSGYYGGFGGVGIGSGYGLGGFGGYPYSVGLGGYGGYSSYYGLGGYSGLSSYNGLSSYDTYRPSYYSNSYSATAPLVSNYVARPNTSYYAPSTGTARSSSNVYNGPTDANDQPVGDLRPGMVLPDGAIVVSVGK